jgi:hypothetical protein
MSREASSRARQIARWSRRPASPRGDGTDRKRAQKRAWCRRKFLRYYPGGFADQDYVDLERAYKWTAHERWREELGRAEIDRLIEDGRAAEVAARAVRIEGRTNLLFSFEKMALRDAVKGRAGAERFARGLREWLHGRGSAATRFEGWVEALEGLPRRQTRVLTWPLATVFGFIAQPDKHLFLKPRVTKFAAEHYGWDFAYQSRPNWETYQSLLGFAEEVRADVADLEPRDMIDLQSFIWVLGSDEYPD